MKFIYMMKISVGKFNSPFQDRRRDKILRKVSIITERNSVVSSLRE